MKELEEDLQERLGLKDKPELRRLDKPSKNTNFLVFVGDLPKYFVKIYNIHEANLRTIQEREKKASAFFYKNRIFPTPEPVAFGENYFLTRYEGRMTNVEIDGAIGDIASFHAKALEFSDYSEFKGNPVFHNDRRERGLIRLRKHLNLVSNLWRDTAEIEEAVLSLDNKLYRNIPKILVHGDLHKGNVQQKEDGRRLFIDFERAYYDYPTWDMARALIDLSPEMIEEITKEYIDAIQNTPLTKRVPDNQIRRAIWGDCLFRLITDTIADQQSNHFTEIAKIHLERYRGFIKEILLKLKETR